MNAGHRERTSQPGIVVKGKAESRPEAAVAVDSGNEAVSTVADSLAAVADEEPSQPRVRERKTKLKLAALRVRHADVLDDEPRALLIERDRPRYVRLLDARIRIAQA